MMKAEEKRNMRKYGKDGRLESVICNRCGRKLAVRNGIVREGVFSSDHAWDFFSEKDGEVHHFDLCEECYDEVTGEFRGRWRRKSRCCKRIKAGGWREVACLFLLAGGYAVSFRSGVLGMRGWFH